MKVTNVSTSQLYFRGLKFVRYGQNSPPGRGEDFYLAAGSSIYLPNTTEVLRSAREGELYAWANSDPALITLEDTETLDANGGPNDTVVLNHNFGLPPDVVAYKKVGATWVDAMGTYDAVHDEDFTTVTFTNATADPLEFFIRLL